MPRKASSLSDDTKNRVEVIVVDAVTTASTFGYLYAATFCSLAILVRATRLRIMWLTHTTLWSVDQLEAELMHVILNLPGRRSRRLC